MENNEVKMPITYEDLKHDLVASGRPYDFAMIDRAYALAEKAHGDQRRRSGEPYICHPLSVAQILVELGMDSESIAAALMHDVAEDTSVGITEIRQKFGDEVALLVDGVTKLTQIKFSNVEDRQAENLRKMLLAMSQDVRVMIIKLCDRLHNMRTGDAWPEQKRRDKALETMEVYAPIAHRLGISNIKEELEDRSLHYLDPVGYETIRDLLNKHGDEFLHTVCHTISKHLSENGIRKATIRHRVKSIYGIYRKMYMQNKDFEEIYDIYAVRIILGNVAECYTALGLIHDMYHPLPNRFKDYISTPKPNGYQSLHTTVIGREAIPFEVQIRTWDMDRMAEYGIAAHWKYKAGITGGEKIEVTGLPANTGYTITESGDTASSYTTTWDGITKTGSDDKTSDAQTMAAADKTITVTNSRTAPTPTGLLLDAAPYGAMLLAAGTGSVLLLRKRHNSDE